MPPSGRTRYPHAFSRSPVKETSQGSRRGSRAAPPPPWTDPGGRPPDTVAACFAEGRQAYARCPACERERALDLKSLAARGLAARPLRTLRLVCRRCGSRACAVEAR